MSPTAGPGSFSYPMFGLRVVADRPIRGLVADRSTLAVPADLRIEFAGVPHWAAEELAASGEPSYSNPVQTSDGRSVATVHQLRSGAYVYVRLTDAADFLIDRPGSHIWIQSTGAPTSVVAAHLLGPIMALTLRLRGLTCLHASAVSLDGRVYAFAGPQGSGKSTLAAALATRGFSVVSDDIVALVDAGGRLLAEPGYPQLWLRPAFGDAVAAMTARVGTWAPDWDGECLGIDVSGPGYSFERAALPLTGLYLIAPPDGEPARPRISALSPREAFIELAGDTWSARLLDREMRASEFDVLGRLMAQAWMARIEPNTRADSLPALCDLIADDIAARRRMAGALAPSRAGGRVGIDPIHVVTMENHDAALYAWRGARAERRVAVHIDAHHDLTYAGDGSRVDIGNYLCAALKQELLREVFWVVPDPTWTNPADRAEIVHQIRVLTRQYPGERTGIVISPDCVATQLLGCPLTVGPLSILRGIDEPVLLDIDADYMVLPHVYGESDAHRSLPWCWPHELMDRLRAAGLTTDLATVAYSVDGGYTPLKWKYLGDELAARLRGADASALAGFEAMRRAIVASGAGGDARTIEGQLQEAEARLPGHAAPAYLLSQWYADRNRLAEAREAYRLAVARDATYRTPYRNPALEYFAEKRFDEAAREHQRSLAIDPEDATAYFGLGRLALRSGRLREAEQWLRDAVGLDGRAAGACRLLAEVLARQGRTDEAIASYERSLMMALDAAHFVTYAALGRLHLRRREHDKAGASFRLAIAGGHDTSRVRFDLGRACAMQGAWTASARELWRGVQLLPRTAVPPLRSGWRRVRRRLRQVRAHWFRGERAHA